MGTPFRELPRGLRFDPDWVFDPVPPWVFDRLDDDVLGELVSVQIEFSRRALQSRLELLDRVEQVVARGIKK